MSYGMKLSRPVGCDNAAMGGAAEDLGLQALAGETELVTVFDDFDGVVPSEAFGDATNWETLGWVLTDVGVPVADTLSMNGNLATGLFDSCIRANAGTADDTGGNAQLDRLNAGLSASGNSGFPHVWIPETGAGAATLDGFTFMFAARLGFVPEGATWGAKAFVGWAQAGDTGILTAATGDIAIPSAGALIGFHALEDGSLRGISHRTAATAMAEGTNFTELIAAAGMAPGAGEPFWVDVALRMSITDQSSASANGATEFFFRPVQAASVHDKLPTWTRHDTVLLNQTPNDAVALVPTIEVANGPAGNEGDLLIDWWAFGASRFSRT